MDACTDTYIEYIADLLMTCGSNPHIAAEKRVDYSRYAPEWSAPRTVSSSAAAPCTSLTISTAKVCRSARMTTRR